LHIRLLYTVLFIQPIQIIFLPKDGIILYILQIVKIKY
jgi:hypothetical protein